MDHYGGRVKMEGNWESEIRPINPHLFNRLGVIQISTGAIIRRSLLRKTAPSGGWVLNWSWQLGIEIQLGN